MKIAQLIHRYLSLHPFERDCLARGLINYSKLSRQICRDEGIRNFDAVLVACRRYASGLKPKKEAENEIISALKRSRINARIEKGTAFISIKLRNPAKGMLSYLSTLFLENRIEIISSRSAKNSITFEIKSKDADKSLGVLRV